MWHCWATGEKSSCLVFMPGRFYGQKNLLQILVGRSFRKKDFFSFFLPGIKRGGEKMDKNRKPWADEECFPGTKYFRKEKSAGKNLWIFCFWRLRRKIKKVFRTQNTGVLGEHPLYGSPHGYAVSRAASAGTAENVPGCRWQSRNQDANVLHLRILPFPDGNVLTTPGLKKTRK